MDQDADHGFLSPPLCEEASYPRGMSDQEVADFLEQNPDFFVSRPHLLQNMTPPARWNNGAVVDLQRHWVDVLTNEIDGLRECASSVIETSRVNLATQARMHAAVLALLDASSLEEMVELVSEELPQLFDVHLACICVEALDDVPEGMAHLPPGTVAGLAGEKDVVLLEDISDDGTLFGPECEAIRSAALVRLGIGCEGEAPAALLAFGSSVPHVFSPRQGKELLKFLGEVVAWRFSRLWETRT
ncbi:MAG: DUF484 family protein [Rhodospirillales bacterium]